MPGTYALTTLARVREFTGLDEDTALLDVLIDRATAVIEGYCNRQFLSRDYSSWLDGTGTDRLFLPQRPVTALVRACRATRDVLDLSNSSTDCAYAVVRVSATGLHLVVSGGAHNGTDNLLFADYATLTLLAAAVTAAGDGWTASARSGCGSFPSTELRPAPGRSALTSIALQAPDEPVDEAEVDETSGCLFNAGTWPEGAHNIFVQYTAGYATVPADLEQVCIDLVKQLYESKEADANLLSETVGGHSTSARTYLDKNKDLYARLARYRRIV